MSIHTLAFGMLVLVSGAYASFKLQLLENTAANGGVCLDGTPGGYYISPGSGSNTKKWILFFEGGGWCYSRYDCWGRSKGSLGSSKSWGSTMTADGFLSDNCTANPTFCDWNRVYMKYCDGNSYSGNLADPITVNGDPVYFRGHLILRAHIAQLARLSSLGDAVEVILGGRSAGGLATYLHADYVHELLLAVAPGLTKYGAVPVSGFFLEHTNVEGRPIYINQIETIFQLSNATAGVNQKCIASYSLTDHWLCNFAVHSYAFTTSRIFVLNSAVDLWQTTCILTSEPVSNPRSTTNGNCSAAPGWSACSKNVESCDADHIGAIIDYEVNFLTDLRSSPAFSASGNGAFIDNCHTHSAAMTSLWNSVKINGVSMQQAVSAWWSGAVDAPAASNTYLPCFYSGGNIKPRRCNPTCPLG